MFSSVIEVLAVENEERTSKRTGNKYNHFAARCVLRDDAGNVITVGTIRSDVIDQGLRDMVKPGLYSATFALKVPDWGESKGDIVTMLTGLVPFATKNPIARAAAAAQG